MKIVINKCCGGFDLSEKAIEMYQEISGQKNFLDIYEIDRNDSILVQVVEKHGKEANGSCSELFIEEVDEENFNFEIEEYDGYESISLKPIVNIDKLTKMNKEEICQYFDELGIIYK